MRKILVVNTAGLGLGGITTHMLNFLGCLSYDDFQIDIIGTIILDHNIMERFQEIGCNVIILKNRKKNLGGYIRQLSELMKKEQYDVIHVHGNSATMVLELRLAETNGIPKRIAHCHNTKCRHRLVNEMLLPFFKNSYTAAAACSGLAGSWLFGRNQFIVLHNAIDIKRFQYNAREREKYRKLFGVSDSILLVGHVGQFNEQKNHIKLMGIFRELLSKKEAKLLLIGEGEKKQQAEAWAGDHGISDKVIFAGMRNDVENLLQAMDVLVFPSKWEGLPVVLVEAQAAGLPIVLSDVISNEIKLMESLKFLNLNETDAVWADEVLKTYFNAQKSGRSIDKDRFQDYDISCESRRLMELYTG